AERFQIVTGHPVMHDFLIDIQWNRIRWCRQFRRGQGWRANQPRQRTQQAGCEPDAGGHGGVAASAAGIASTRRERRQPRPAAAAAATALSAAKPPMLTPMPRNAFMLLAIARSPKRHTAVSTTFCPL